MEFCREHTCPFTDCEDHPKRAPFGFAYTAKPLDETCDRLAAHRAEEAAQQDRLNRMTMGDAFIIFQNINTDSATDVEKALAIKKIVDLETHMGVTKKMMLEVIRWLLGQSFEFDDPNG